MHLRSLHVLAAAAATLFTAAPPALHAAPDTTRVIVAFKPGAAAAGRAAVATARGVVKHEIYGANAVSIEVPAQALRGLANNPSVEYVEDDVLRFPFGTSLPSTGAPYTLDQQVPYGIAMVQADQLPDTYAANRKVCIIDSGYDRTHEDLSANSVTGEYDVGTGWWYDDETHHGTHVAGTIAAINNAAGVVGVNANGQLKLHIVKVFTAAGWAYSSTLTSAANKCKAAGANVINMSLGGASPTRTEERAFDQLLSAGILPIAAAGNAGTSAVSYPAGYGSVVSVAAIDEAKARASFSQTNADVEIAGPGVNVLSTVPVGRGTASALRVGTTTYAPGAIVGSPKATATAPLADFGLGNATSVAVAGKVCLIARGTVDFATKVSNCQASGGVGAVIYNNVAGGFGATLGTTVTSIPSVTASDAEGAAMRSALLGQTATVAVTAASYASQDGTSMATPHVAAVAALVWSYHPKCTAAQLRTSLTKAALDLGAAGRDMQFGFGLVRAKATHDRIKALGCGK